MMDATKATQQAKKPFPVVVIVPGLFLFGIVKVRSAASHHNERKIAANFSKLFSCETFMATKPKRRQMNKEITPAATAHANIFSHEVHRVFILSHATEAAHISIRLAKPTI